MNPNNLDLNDLDLTELSPLPPNLNLLRECIDMLNLKVISQGNK